MEKVLERSREQDNLLDRFIRNEKRSRLWAILSVLAFVGVSGSVLTVAYKIKNSGDHVVTTDTVLVTKTDTVVNTTIDTIYNTISDTEAVVKLQTIWQENERLKEIHTRDSLQMARLIILLRECKQNPPQKAPTVLIHCYNKTDSVQLPNVLTSIIKTKFSIVYYQASLLSRSRVPLIGIVYYDTKFETQANSFKDALNNSAAFEPRLNLQVKLVDPASTKPGADIEIWMSYRSLRR